jgi:hypothetical protein
MTLAERIAALDATLFDAIETETTPGDRQSLLALHQAARRDRFAYLEIGSHLGGSLQVLVRDERCERIVSIDSRPPQQPDERGHAFFYPENLSKRMRALLAELPQAELGKLTTIDASTATLKPEEIDLSPRFCFVDAEHTDEAVGRDARFCAQVLAAGGWVAFHDAGVVYRGLRRFIEELQQSGVHHRVYFLPDTILVVEFGEPKLLETPQVLAQIIANWEGYLRTLHDNDRYRELARQPVLTRLLTAFLSRSLRKPNGPA